MRAIELKKCSSCSLTYSLDFFRSKKNQCKDCERKIQRENRLKRRELTGKRFDDTRLTTSTQKEAMKCLRDAGWLQAKIALAFHTNQSRVSQILREIEG